MSKRTKFSPVGSGCYTPLIPAFVEPVQDSQSYYTENPVSKNKKILKKKAIDYPLTLEFKKKELY